MSIGRTGPAVVLRSVSKSFGAGAVVSDVSFCVERGTCFGLLGPNGAGKSTTLKMICGFLRPSSGTILVGGTDVSREPRKARAMLGIAPQEDLLDSDLDVFQNLVFHARYHGIPKEESRRRSRETLREMGLESHADAPVAHLSTGLRRRLVLARALLNAPQIVILDEPTRGLDQESRQRYLETLRSLKAGGATLVLATHDLTEAELLCDRAGILDAGRIRSEGALWDILEAYRGTLPPPPRREAPAC